MADLRPQSAVMCLTIATIKHIAFHVRESVGALLFPDFGAETPYDPTA